ncbi:two-component system response regulator YesN [Aequitasia blattaphilus]|uniref:Stage 0 sporulation protein A homolog n=1 Tax=Aequitasia blattaphilus TaxID=2949332 RepID=A0ABT1E8I2_9FIRM|nr:response regulator [Aequitasia blattaphilus]MCP1102011.1 response regulator [Aequitasia blattaphilus]MCR8614651.1 response regulator [Aequitasia blattaphilus]
MNLYKVLLVDDELEIREGMEKKISWNELGFSVAGVAENGVEALELVGQIMPDVILTDIKMPFMNGLELIERVVKILPGVKIIVFSGFDDFEYAQKAINYGVEEYILKPVSSVSLEESLRKLKTRMDEEIAYKRDIDRLRMVYEESFSTLRERFLVNAMEGVLSLEELKEKEQTYVGDLRGRYKCVAVLSYENSSLQGGEESIFYGKEELIPISLRQSTDEILRDKFDFISFHYRDQVVVAAGMEWDSKITLFIEIMNHICKESRKITGVHVTAGVGGLKEGWSEIKYSYKEALYALEYSTLLGEAGDFAFYSKDILSQEEKARIEFDEFDERNLIAAIKNNDLKTMDSMLDVFFGKLKEARMPYYQYQTYMLEIITAVLKVANSYRVEYESVFGEEEGYISRILEGHSIEYIRDWLKEVCHKIGNLLQTGRANTGKALVLRAKQYAEVHFRESSLSVEIICEELGVSPAYFSTIFKKETKENFITYLTELRMKEAKHLLDTTEDKTYMIATKVGYTEANYFSYVFKKSVGMSPSKYRRREGE